MKVEDSIDDIKFIAESDTEIFELGHMAQAVGGYVGSFEGEPKYLYLNKRRLYLHIIGENK